MGNSSSKAPSKAYKAGQIRVSAPEPLKAADGKDTYLNSTDADLRRRATTHTTTSHPSLAVPSSATHRRARSALAGPARERIPSQAPPSYQESISPWQASNRHSGNFLAVPTSAPEEIHRSRSNPAIGTNNPFRRRSASPSPSGTFQLNSRATASSSTSGRPLSESDPEWSMNKEQKIRYLQQPMRQESYEDALETLRRYNTVIVVDDSGSMRMGNRWQEARTALSNLAQLAAAYDQDGLDIYFLNSRKTGKNYTTKEQVERLFDSVTPTGATPIAEILDRLLQSYLAELASAKLRNSEASVRPVNFIVLTDGAPTDEPADVIVKYARDLDTGGYLLSQVGIQFVQIGNDSYATEFLRALDDDLGRIGNVRDIVDTTPYTGGEITAEMMVKILLGGINRRVDRKGGRSVMQR